MHVEEIADIPGLPYISGGIVQDLLLFGLFLLNFYHFSLHPLSSQLVIVGLDLDLWSNHNHTIVFHVIATCLAIARKWKSPQPPHNHGSDIYPEQPVPDGIYVC